MNMFIPLFKDDDAIEDVEGIIRSDSIAEVWLNKPLCSVVVRYMAPSDGHIINHEEQYDSYSNARKRYFQILSHIVDEYKSFEDINGLKFTKELIKSLEMKEAQ